MLRTHSHTDVRIRRLLELEGRLLDTAPRVSERTRRPLIERPVVLLIDPRLRASGLWS